MKSRTLRILSFVLRNLGVMRYVVDSYSQEGEDMIINRLLEGQRQGFYVDVGAHHPFRFSNTFRFYVRGWRGINVEPSPEANRLFLRARRRDINVQVGISDVPGSLTYHRFDEPALNTFDQELVAHREGKTNYRVVGTESVQVVRLDSLLDQYLPAGAEIDFLSVDTEGFDLRVLRSNDWTRFRPRLVLAEALEKDMNDLLQCDIHKFMVEQGYVFLAKTLNTLFYQDCLRPEEA